MDIEKYLEEKKKFIDSVLEVVVSPLKEHSVLYAAMSYSLLSGGKRLRPILMLTTYNAFNKDEEAILPFASAIEMIHTYSLIHDDLPLMDNSDLRRGKPTCHKIYGDDMALLAGDALISFAFELISNPSNLKNFSAESVLSVIYDFGVYSGIKGLVGGQVMDIVTSGMDSVDEDTILYIEKKKTASLITLSVRSGGILGGAAKEEMDSLTNFGMNLGISYQIIDDILDAISTPDVLGKDTMQDKKNEKATFVALYGVDRAKEIAEEFVQKAVDYLIPFGDKYKTLIEIANFSLKRIN
jgi:geranylgeranyl diphosphate synthase type II